MNESVSDDYSPTETPPSDSLPCNSSHACKGHSLWSESYYTVSFTLVPIQQLCPNQAFLLQNDLLCALGKNFEGRLSRFLHHKHFVNTTMGNGGLCAWKCFGCHYGQLGKVLNLFLDKKVIWTGNKWWRGTHSRGSKVRSVGCGVEFECEDVTQKVGTALLFRRKDSGHPGSVPTAELCT